MKKSKIFGFLLILAIVLQSVLKLTFFSVSKVAAGEEEVFMDSGINYVESLEDIANPERGFYKPTNIMLTSSGGSSVPTESSLRDKINTQQSDSGSSGNSNVKAYTTITHLLVGLNAFSENSYYFPESLASSSGGSLSSAVKGVTQPLTDEALDHLKSALKNVRASGATAMLRFSYNVFGWGINTAKQQLAAGDKISPATYLNAEPELSVILAHIEQLKPVLAQYADVIMCVETGFVGPWGEMHSTQMAKRPSSVVSIMNALLDALPEERTILVRNPGLFLAWYNLEYDAEAYEKANANDYEIIGKYAFEEKALSGKQYINIADIPMVPGSKAARIGMYNDAYLSDSADMGTFVGNTSNPAKDYSRNLAIDNWLSLNPKFYGGEAIQDSRVMTYNMSSIQYAAWEAFKTQTSHLNFDYDRKTFRSWASSDYSVATLGSLTGSFKGGAGQGAVLDELYADAGANGFQYFRNHLGYRLVLRDCLISQPQSIGGTLTVKGKIENVGFGSLVNPKKAALILKNRSTGSIYTHELEISPNNWKASSGLVPFEFTVEMKNGSAAHSEGVYDIYLKVYDKLDPSGAATTLRTVRFANSDSNMWNADLAANRIGVTANSADAVLVRFVDGNGATLQEDFLQKGSVPVYSGSVPSGPVSNGVATVFDGWDQPIAALTGPVIFTAQYKLPQYEIIFYDDDENLLAKLDIAYGERITQDDMKKVPASYESGDYLCTITGWTKTLSGQPTDIYEPLVTGTAKYYAIVSIELKPPVGFTITFSGGGGNLSSGNEVQDVTEGGNAVPPVYSRDGYDFDGWDSQAYQNVSGNATIIAKWKVKESLNEIPDSKKGCAGSFAGERSPFNFVLEAGISVFIICVLLLKRKQI